MPRLPTWLRCSSRPQDSRATAAAAAAALARGGSFSTQSDIEAPLLGGGHRAAGQEAAANGGPSLPPSPPVVKPKPEAGGGQHARRDAKALWALVRNALGGAAWGRAGGGLGLLHGGSAADALGRPPLQAWAWVWACRAPIEAQPCLPACRPTPAAREQA